MKKKILYLLIAAPLFSIGQVKNVESTIQNVTVFFNGAQISRTASTPLSIGRTELVFKNISPLLDPESIQIRADNSNLAILGISHRFNYLEQNAKKDSVSELSEGIRVLQERVALLNNQLNAFAQEENLLQRNQVQVVGIQNTTLKIEDLKQLAEYQRIRYLEINNKKIEINKDVKKLNDDINRMMLQREELNAQKVTTRSEIVVAVMAKNALSNVKIDLDYLVANASWNPTYDLRVRDISTPLNMLLKANVVQNTNEDWQNVRLTLSTGNPSEGGTRPQLQPWRLGARPTPVFKSTPSYSTFRRPPSITRVTGRVTDASGEAIVGASIVAKGTINGTVTNVDGVFAINLSPNDHILVVNYVGYNTQEVPITQSQLNITITESAVSLSEVVVVGYGSSRKKMLEKAKREDDKYTTKPAPIMVERQEITTSRFDIELPYTIASGAQAFSVDIKEITAPAQYQYYVVPKLDRDAFLTAQVSDWESLSLLSGEANLYLEGTFVGKTFINTQTAEDTLSISLGRDKNVSVERIKLKDFSKKAFLSDKTTQSRGYEISVRNKKSTPLSIIIEDQVPLTSSDNFSVSFEANEAKYDAETGKLTWNLKVDNAKEKKVKFNYTVKYPSTTRLILD